VKLSKSFMVDLLVEKSEMNHWDTCAVLCLPYFSSFKARDFPALELSVLGYVKSQSRGFSALSDFDLEMTFAISAHLAGNS